MSMRELGGRPTPGMSAGIYAIAGGEEQSRLNFMIIRNDPQARTAELRHIVSKSADPADWIKNGLRILSELHYHETDQFENRLSALFSLDSNLAAALIEAGQCHLKITQDSIEHGFDFDVVSVDQDDAFFQATYWHNRLFNPTLPGNVLVLAFNPRL
ncbi:MAG: hypothetical protein GY785_25815 [Gammaproteobacteria bacterium]|nr:hypothetical protein [Gammaproteobacteria bacterium]